MRPRLLWPLLVGPIGLLWAACATGDDTPGDDPATGGHTTTGGTAGSGGATASTTTTTTTTSSSTGGAGGGAFCDETPCRLVAPQCGCGPDEQCEVGGPAPSGRQCVDEGDVAIGGQCSGSGTCEPGALCIDMGENICLKLCSADAQCDAPGGLCLITLDDGDGGVIPDATLCTSSCDPITSDGCDIAGMSCKIGREQTGNMRAFTFCVGTGTGVDDEPCVNSADCAFGYGCFAPAPTTCRRWCEYLQPLCPTGACVHLEPPTLIGGVEYGVCE